MKRTILLSAVLSLLLTACTVKIQPEHFIRPDRAVTQQWLDQQQQGQTLQPYQITAADGVVLHGKLIRHPNARFTLLYFGGNMFHSDRESLDIVKALGQFQNNLLMLDYRGYNGNSGTPDVSNLAADGVALFDAVQADASLAKVPVLLHGFSLGSVVAAHVAGERPAAALVLQGSVTNVAEMAAARTPFWLKPFLRYDIAPELSKVDNQAVLARIQTPLLICVGADDSETPAQLSKQLYAAAASPLKQLYIAEDIGHGNLFVRPEAVAQYQTFIRRVFSSPL